MNSQAYLCGTFFFISLGLVSLVSLREKRQVVEPAFLFFSATRHKTSAFSNRTAKYPTHSNKIPIS